MDPSFEDYFSLINQLTAMNATSPILTQIMDNII